MMKFATPILIALFALFGLGYYIYQDLSLVESGKNQATTTSDGSVVITDAEGNKAVVEMEKVPAQKLPPPPSLDRPFTAPAHALQMKGEYEALVKTLRDNPTAIQTWIVLGAYRKNVGDYEGAIEAWLYASTLSPRDHVSLSNLADVYDFHLKDYAKAESYYLKTVAVKPDLIATWRALSSLYQYRYQTETTKAADVLKQGLAKNPGNIDLLISLGMYYKGKGNAGEAKKYLLEARAAAEKSADSALMARIDGELASL